MKMISESMFQYAEFNELLTYICIYTSKSYRNNNSSISLKVLPFVAFELNALKAITIIT